MRNKIEFHFRKKHITKLNFNFVKEKSILEGKKIIKTKSQLTLSNHSQFLSVQLEYGPKVTRKSVQPKRIY